MTIRSTDEDLVRFIKDQITEKEFAAFCIVSDVEIDKLSGQFEIVKQFEGSCDITSEIGNIVVAKKSEHKKCQRCWNYRPSVGSNSEYPDLCDRCVDVIRPQRH